MVGLCFKHRVTRVCVSLPLFTRVCAAPGEEAWPRGAEGSPDQLPESELLPGSSFSFPLSFLSLPSSRCQQQPRVGRALGWLSGTFVPVPGAIADLLWVPRQLPHPPAPAPSPHGKLGGWDGNK